MHTVAICPPAMPGSTSQGGCFQSSASWRIPAVTHIRAYTATDEMISELAAACEALLSQSAFRLTAEQLSDSRWWGLPIQFCQVWDCLVQDGMDDREHL